MLLMKKLTMMMSWTMLMTSAVLLFASGLPVISTNCHRGNRLHESTDCDVSSLPLIPPTITKQPSDYVICNTGRGFICQLECAAIGYPKPEILWRRRDDLPVNGTVTSGTLKLLSSEDSGQYQCLAKNDAGIAFTGFSTVHVVSLGHDSYDDIDIRKSVGDVVELPCSVFYPGVTVTWQKIIIDVTPTERIAISDNGSLIITSAELEDASDYICKISFGSRYQMGRIIHLNVDPSTNQHPVSGWLSGSSEQTSPTGNDVTLTCIFKGSVQSIGWSRQNGQKVQEKDLSDFNRRLTLHDVTVHDTDNYTCSAHYEYVIGTKITVNFNISVVIVGAKPSIVTPLSSTNFTVDKIPSTIRFHCQVTGDPTPEITWYTNVTSLSGTSDATGNWQLSTDQSELTLLSRGLPVVVTCNASNQHGYQLSSGYVGLLPLNSPSLDPAGSTGKETVVNVPDASTTTLSGRQEPQNQSSTKSFAVIILILILGALLLLAIPVVIYCMWKRPWMKLKEKKSQPMTRNQEKTVPDGNLDGDLQIDDVSDSEGSSRTASLGSHSLASSADSGLDKGSMYEDELDNAHGADDAEPELADDRPAENVELLANHRLNSSSLTLNSANDPEPAAAAAVPVS